MNVSEAGRRRTGDLIDQTAHDAGLVDKKHHVEGSVTMESGREIHRHRHVDEIASVARDAARDSALGATTQAVEATGLGYSVMAAELGSIALFTSESLQELNRAEKKGDEVRAGFDNDAVNIAVAGNLKFDSAFQEFERIKRPGVSKEAVAKLTTELQKPQNEGVRVVLQQRADEGFRAADQAAATTKAVPPEQRSAAIAQWFRDNGYADRMKHDVAFGKGVEYHAFVQDPRAEKLGLGLEKARTEVRSREVPAPPVRVRP